MEPLTSTPSVKIKKRTRLNGLQIEFTVSGVGVEPQSTGWLWDLPALHNYNHKRTSKCLQSVKNDLAFIASCSSEDLNVLNSEELRLIESFTSCQLEKAGVKG